MPKIEKSPRLKDLERAKVLMKTFAQVVANKKALTDSIKNEMDAYNNNMKEIEAELLEIGARNRDQFDENDNLVFDEGYVHIAHNAVVVTTKKFDASTFSSLQPDLIKQELRVALIKKAFQDKDKRKELISLGVELDTEEQMQVLLNKKTVG